LFFSFSPFTAAIFFFRTFFYPPFVSLYGRSSRDLRCGPPNAQGPPFPSATRAFFFFFPVFFFFFGTPRRLFPFFSGCGPLLFLTLPPKRPCTPLPLLFFFYAGGVTCKGVAPPFPFIPDLAGPYRDLFLRGETRGGSPLRNFFFSYSPFRNVRPVLFFGEFLAPWDVGSPSVLRFGAPPYLFLFTVQPF